MSAHNKYGKEILQERLKHEPFKRHTLSFYRYTNIPAPDEFRTMLFRKFDAIQVLGRIYVAKEGINAQLSVPAHHFQEFINTLDAIEQLEQMRLNLAIEDDGQSFFKLIVKLKDKIVADGLDDENYNFSKVGQHLSPKDFNALMANPDAIIVDMRNHYESEVGHFKDAICPDVDTFREQLPMVKEMLDSDKEKPLLLYCTGGIRCEKASAYLLQNGFKNVNQLHGGIIEYARRVQQDGIENKFLGKNFVFDERLGERISEEVISNCHQCGKPSDRHRNCALDECHLLFIQCEECEVKNNGCCDKLCTSLMDASKEERSARAKEVPGFEKHAARAKC